MHSNHATYTASRLLLEILQDTLKLDCHSAYWLGIQYGEDWESLATEVQRRLKFDPDYINLKRRDRARLYRACEDLFSVVQKEKQQ